MSSRAVLRMVPWWLPGLLFACLTACARESGTHPGDAAIADVVAANDLGHDVVDAREPDASDAPEEDAPARDAGVDARPDVPGVMLGGYFIPVDPNAVPPPGSECVGDGGVREGDPTVAPPRPIRPLSVSRVTSQRPTFQWVLPEGTTGARVEVCADRCCTRVLQTIDAEGTTVRPTVALPAGVVFWRMFGRRGTVVGSRASFTWEFGVRRRDAPNDTTWSTLRDFNGDGYDDLVVLARRGDVPPGGPGDVLLVPGSERGLREPLRNGSVVPRLPRLGSVGDFNGDGLADVTWGSHAENIFDDPGWVDVQFGTRDGLRPAARLEITGIDDCPTVDLPSALDWDGDGYSDIVTSVEIRCDVTLPPLGSYLFIYRGSGRGLAHVPQYVARVDNLFRHRRAGAYFPFGDLDLDGYGDAFLVSSYVGAGTTSIPPEYVIVHGTTSGEPRYERLIFPPASGGNYVTALGDVDGDNHLDWSWYVEGGGFYIYRHANGNQRPSETLRDRPVRIPGGYFGANSSGGDVNGDGLCDVIASGVFDRDEDMPAGFAVDGGRVYAFLGVRGGLSPIPAVVVGPPPAGSSGPRVGFFGGGAMSPGDVNGDGIDDIIMSDQVGNSLCTYYGRTETPPNRPDLCVSGWWPSFERYL